MSEEERPAYDPTGITPSGSLPAEPGRALPPLREMTEIRKPSTAGGAIYLAVLVSALVGVGIASLGPWRTGVSWLGVSLFAGAVARLVLPDDGAGMLRVRRKSLDAALLIAVGAALAFLAGSIPEQFAP